MGGAWDGRRSARVGWRGAGLAGACRSGSRGGLGLCVAGLGGSSWAERRTMSSRKTRSKNPRPLEAQGSGKSTQRGGAARAEVVWWRISGGEAAVCAVLVALVWAVFGQTAWFDFVNYDDDHWLYENAVIKAGLTLEGVRYAFTETIYGHWAPLTTLSHMAACQFFGVGAGAQHAVNVALHAIGAVLCFLVLRRMTGGVWPSVWVAALFAVHPLRVESVAWVTERKDVLSGVFFFLTVGAYGWYVREPRAHWRYIAVLGFFLLGLMSKSMLVTLPFVLLLLDVWPLRRCAWPGANASGAGFGSWLRDLGRLIFEKSPLFVVAAIMCIVQMRAATELTVTLEELPLSLRLANAAAAYGAYVRELFWPAGLAVFYPHLGEALPAWQWIVGAAVLAGGTVLACLARGRAPYLLVGWCWFLGMLAPVIGLVQSGAIARADRYNYLPQLGLGIMAAWGLAAAAERWRWPRAWLGFGGVITILAASVAAWQQTQHWRNSETLWRHALAVTRDNFLAYNNLGLVHASRKESREAVTCYLEAIRANPKYMKAYANLGTEYVRLRNPKAAIEAFHQALALAPQEPLLHKNLAYALLFSGRAPEAIASHDRALELGLRSAFDVASFGNYLWIAGEPEQAARYYAKALEFSPGALEPTRRLAWLLATGPERGDDEAVRGKTAVELAGQAAATAAQEGKKIVSFQMIVAAAQARAGNFPEAVKIAEAALVSASTDPEPRWSNALKEQLALYKAGKSYRDPSAGTILGAPF